MMLRQQAIELLDDISYSSGTINDTLKRYNTESTNTVQACIGTALSLTCLLEALLQNLDNVDERKVEEARLINELCMRDLRELRENLRSVEALTSAVASVAGKMDARVNDIVALLARDN